MTAALHEALKIVGTLANDNERFVIGRRVEHVVDIADMLGAAALIEREAQTDELRRMFAASGTLED